MLQDQLRQPAFALPRSNEVQKVDISITQPWMRTLVWQLAMKHVSMSASAGDDSIFLTDPVHIAEDALTFLSKVRLDSLVAHGPGMVRQASSLINFSGSVNLFDLGDQNIRDCKYPP